ncbi:MAG: ABC transporter permease [Hyphomicrobiales bacterium]|nr:MAG: ABC transporter permease [Hyphomicrobiales bacterium]
MSEVTVPGYKPKADGPASSPSAVDKHLSAGQWQLMWWKFGKHKLAVASGIVLLMLYLVALLAEFVATTDPNAYNSRYTYAPPQAIKLFRTTPEGEFSFGLHANGLKSEVDPKSLRRSFVEDPDTVVPIGFFVQGAPYVLAGVIPWDRHLIGPVDSSQPFYLMGSDRLGRDVFSRVMHGTRVSMSIGLVGVVLSLGLGILLGGLSGYFGGATDVAIQRVIEFLISLPTIPLWMGLAAAIPLTWDPLAVYFLVTVILSLFGWTQLARQVRGLFFSLKNEDYVTAARLDGNSELRVILRHMVPAFTSHIIASVTLAIPAMILAETALSFLGIGLRSPVISWGVLLQEAQNIRSIGGAPWLLWPGMAVVIAVLALNFLGDGLRDAADPYEQN